MFGIWKHLLTFKNLVLCTTRHTQICQFFKLKNTHTHLKLAESRKVTYEKTKEFSSLFKLSALVIEFMDGSEMKPIQVSQKRHLFFLGNV